MKEEIRVVDFSRAVNTPLGNDNQEVLNEVSKEIVECFEKIGFVYLKNYGISQTEIDNLFQLSDNFFSLPYEVKKRYSRPEVLSSGYLEPSREIFNKAEDMKELRESYDLLQDFNKGNFVPKEVEGFEGTVQQMMEKFKEVLIKFLRCLEIGIDLPFGTLLNIHNDFFPILRLLHYPPITFDVSENCIRCGTHTDYGTITFLFQDSIGGLEVKNRNNEWVQAHPVPGAILVNAGDMLQTLTSGRLIATPHRVLIPEEERRKKCSRKSVAFFVIPNLEAVLKPFEALQDDKKSYPTSHEYLFSRLSSTLIIKN